MGKIFLYTGTGAGKTTNAIGLAVRAVGHGLRVVIIQFMKGWKTGEYLVAERLKPEYEIYLAGREGWVNIKNPSEEDKELARKGLLLARDKLREKPDLLVLDELALATYVGLVPVEDVLKLLDELPEETDVVLTGRYAPPELFNRADFVNMVVEAKSPRELYTKTGITH
ncbi:MAG: cob(I)yrinic acid a,c-diamide adenosyltransferase [Candidatus Brockarchaeota archaeon]|nr:cob(I)yrinic acid a,c-diamide adenosyltransferase [Candidatus Brockarchaeota archaeon]